MHEFFGKIDQFQDGARHPKWREFNVAAEIPGWNRFGPAADWIAENRKVAMVQGNGAPPSGNVQALFEQYLSNNASPGQKALSDKEREVLFGQFRQFLAVRNQQ